MSLTAGSRLGPYEILSVLGAGGMGEVYRARDAKLNRDVAIEVLLPAVDKRTDIWAFGCVLFEMLTGARAFAGDDVTDTIVSVVSKEPAWEMLPPNVAPEVRRLPARHRRSPAPTRTAGLRRRAVAAGCARDRRRVVP